MTQNVLERPALHCHTCGGQCCRYFALQLDTPVTAGDFDDLRWYLAHQQVAIFVEDTDWYLQVNTPCRYLQADHACGIYDRRPQICREYGWDETGEVDCHGTGEAEDHDAFFETLEQFEAYLAQRNLPAKEPGA